MPGRHGAGGGLNLHHRLLRMQIVEVVEVVEVVGRDAARARTGSHAQRGGDVDAAAGYRLARQGRDDVGSAHDAVPDLGRRYRRVRGAEQCGFGSDVRSRHGRARHHAVAVVGQGREDVVPGSEDVDPARREVREARRLIRRGRRTDGDDVRVRRVRRELRRRVEVRAVVAGRDRHHDTGRLGMVDHALQDCRHRAGATPRCVDDRRVVIHRVVDRRGSRRDRDPTVGHGNVQRHDLRAGRGAGDTHAVPGGRGDDPGDVRAVPQVLVRTRLQLPGRVAVHEVPTAAVADETVAVIVRRRVARLVRVGPQGRGQVGVRGVDRRVDDRDDRAGAAGLRPGGGHLRVGTRGHVAGLDEIGVTPVLQGPLLVRHRIVADVVDGERHEGVRGDSADPGCRSQGLRRRGGAHRDVLRVDHHDGRVGQRAQPGRCRHRRCGIEVGGRVGAEQQPARALGIDDEVGHPGQQRVGLLLGHAGFGTRRVEPDPTPGTAVGADGGRGRRRAAGQLDDVAVVPTRLVARELDARCRRGSRRPGWRSRSRSRRGSRPRRSGGRRPVPGRTSAVPPRQRRVRAPSAWSGRP